MGSKEAETPMGSEEADSEGSSESKSSSSKQKNRFKKNRKGGMKDIMARRKTRFVVSMWNENVQG